MSSNLINKYTEISNEINALQNDLNEKISERVVVLKELHEIVGDSPITVQGKDFKIAKRGDTYFLFDLSVKRGRTKKEKWNQKLTVKINWSNIDLEGEGKRMFRLNYGNGQVSRDLDTFKEAQYALRRQKEYSARIGQGDITYIQEYVGDGEWVKVRE
jgi:hypothetical protein